MKRRHTPLCRRLSVSRLPRSCFLSVVPVECRILTTPAATDFTDGVVYRTLVAAPHASGSLLDSYCPRTATTVPHTDRSTSAADHTPSTKMDIANPRSSSLCDMAQGVTSNIPDDSGTLESAAACPGGAVLRSVALRPAQKSSS